MVSVALDQGNTTANEFVSQYRYERLAGAMLGFSNSANQIYSLSLKKNDVFIYGLGLSHFLTEYTTSFFSKAGWDQLAMVPIPTQQASIFMPISFSGENAQYSKYRYDWLRMLPDFFLPFFILKFIMGLIGNMYSQFQFELAVISKMFMAKSAIGPETASRKRGDFGSVKRQEKKITDNNMAHYTRVEFSMCETCRIYCGRNRCWSRLCNFLTMGLCCKDKDEGEHEYEHEGGRGEKKMIKRQDSGSSR